MPSLHVIFGLDLPNQKTWLHLWESVLANVLCRLFFLILFAVRYSHNQRWSPRGRPWPRGRPRGHILKSLALASKPQVLENCPVLGSRLCPRLEDSTIFWTVEISLENARNLAENLRTTFLFSSIGAKAYARGGGAGPPIEILPMTKMRQKKPIVSSVSVSF